MTNKQLWPHSIISNFSSIRKFLYLSATFSIFITPAFSATYDTTQDYGKKTIYLRDYKITEKQGSHYKTGKTFTYKEGYLIYSETPLGATREAACLADICKKWTDQPNSFKEYEDKKAITLTSERLTENNNMEECIMEMKLVNFQDGVLAKNGKQEPAQAIKKKLMGDATDHSSNARPNGKQEAKNKSLKKRWQDDNGFVHYPDGSISGSPVD